MKYSATVVWFNKTKGFGFASAEGLADDVLVHQSAIEMEGFRYLKPNQKIEIEGLVETEKVLRAVKITPVG